MSRKIIFIDAFSTIHVGNGALLDNSYRLASEVFSSDDIAVITSDVETNRGRYSNLIEDVFSSYPKGVLKKLIWSIVYVINCVGFFIYASLGVNQDRWVLNKSFLPLFKSLSDADVIVSVSGETINDHFAPQMYMRCLLFYICIKLKKEFYVFPQSIGPVFRGLSRKVLAKALGSAKLIFARDNQSFILAKDIWSEESVKVLFCPDVAVLQDSNVYKEFDVFRNNKKVIGVTLSRVANEMTGSDGYQDKVLAAISEGLDVKTHSILMMPSNYSKAGVSEDYAICSEAKMFLSARGFEVEILPNKPIHPDVYQGILKALDFFITSRMHVGILATSAGVPTLMLNTQHKIKGYMNNIGMSDFVFEYCEIKDRLPKLIEKCKCENENEKIKIKLIEKNRLMRKLVREIVFSGVAQ